LIKLLLQLISLPPELIDLFLCGLTPCLGDVDLYRKLGNLLCEDTGLRLRLDFVLVRVETNNTKHGAQKHHGGCSNAENRDSAPVPFVTLAALDRLLAILGGSRIVRLHRASDHIYWITSVLPIIGHALSS
jgi:hypothetical protein